MVIRKVCAHGEVHQSLCNYLLSNPVVGSKKIEGSGALVMVVIVIQITVAVLPLAQIEGRRLVGKSTDRENIV
jgi:hypothetical protein